MACRLASLTPKICTGSTPSTNMISSVNSCFSIDLPLFSFVCSSGNQMSFCPALSQLQQALNLFFPVLCLEDTAASYQYLSTGRRKCFNVLTAYARINLNKKLRAGFSLKGNEFPDLVVGSVDELLPAEPGIDTHQKDEIHIGKNRLEKCDRRGRVDNHTRHATLVFYVLYRSVEMWARLVMYSYEVCTCIGKIFNIVVRLFNHEVDIQDRFRSGVPGNLDNIRTVADIGYKMAIHNITMDPFRSCVYALFDLTPQSGKISDKY